MRLNNGHADGGSDGGVDGVAAVLEDFVADGAASVVVGHNLVGVFHNRRSFWKMTKDDLSLV